MKKIITALASAACLLCTATVQAGVYKLDFKATNFSDQGAYNSPQDPVSGSIVFTADSLGSPVISIDGIDLTIGSHSYKVDEIGTAYFGTSGYIFGGNGFGLGGVASNTDDFYILVYIDNAFNGFMGYAVTGTPGIWDSDDFTSMFTEQVAAVPEPNSLALLLAGLGGFSAMLRRRRH